MTEQRVQRRLAAILAADVVGYSRMMEADEAGTLARLKAVRRDIVDPTIAAYAGRMVKLMGDGALVEFASAVDAVACALEIQKLVRASRPEDRPIRFRVGINVGDIIVEGDDIYGDGVNIAARIEGLAQPGEVYISRAAADQVRDKGDIHLEKRGEHTLKNIARPIEVYRATDREPGASPSRQQPAQTPSPVTAKPSIAVLAFNNMSRDPEQAYFSDGISEDIITDLSKVSGLHVIARNSSFVYKDGAVSIPQVAQELGVRYILEGSVRKAGNRVRVNAQLIDASGGSGHVWADRFDRDLTDIFAVQDELTQEIVGALRLKLTAEDEDRLAHRSAVDIGAYNLFLRGREQVWLHTRTGNAEARVLLGQAIAIEPDYAAAHSYVSFSHTNDYANSWTDDPAGTLKTALEIAERAVAMDDKEPLTHFALGAARHWGREPDRALAEAESCIALEPNAAEGRMLKAHVQVYGGNPRGAIGTIHDIIRLDPHYKDIVLYFLAEAHFALREFVQAADALEQRLTRNQQSATSLALLASCYGHLGRFAESRTAWADAVRVDPDFSIERRRQVLPFRNPADFEIRVDGLRKAGLVD